MSPRSCFIAPFPPSRSGIAKYSKILYDPLKEMADHDLIVWNYTGVHKWLAPIIHFKKLLQACDRYDIIHIQYACGDFYPLFLPSLALASKNGKVKIVLTLHEQYDNVRLKHLIIWYHNFIYSFFDALVVHSPWQAAALPDSLKGRIHIQHLAIPHKIARTKSNRGGFILLPGYINRWKGHDLALYALSDVIKHMPNIKLVIAGKPHDNAYSERLKEIVKELDLDDHVIWRSGYIPDTGMEQLYRTCDIAIVPYQRTTMSAVLSEVIAYGIPAVISDLEPFRWYTDNKAIYFKRGDAKDLARKILILLNNPKRADKIRIEFAQLSKEHSCMAIAKKTLELYKKLII